MSPAYVIFWQATNRYYLITVKYKLGRMTKSYKLQYERTKLGGQGKGDAYFWECLTGVKYNIKRYFTELSKGFEIKLTIKQSSN